MTKVVYKYPLEFVAEQALTLPKDSVILSVKEQNGGAVLWAMVDTEAPSEKLGVRMVMTGVELSEDASEALGTFVDTVVLSYGGLVLHYFVRKI